MTCHQKEKREKRCRKRCKEDPCSNNNPPYPQPGVCLVDDNFALEVQGIWQAAFPDAALLPVIGYPSNSGGVGTLTHTMGTGMLMSINGLTSKSPLANNALYSFECTDSRYLNLYEIMMPDIPGENGEDSTAEIYVKLLYSYGLSVAGVHFHWWGSSMVPGNTLVAAVHHQAIGMDPREFSRRTVQAIKEVMAIIVQRI